MQSAQLEQWHLPSANGEIAVQLRLVGEKSPIYVKNDFVAESSGAAAKAAVFFALKKLCSAQHVFPLIIAGPQKKSPTLLTTAKLQFSILIPGENGPEGDRPLLLPHSSPIEACAKLSELLQVLADAALALELPVLSLVPSVGGLTLELKEAAHELAAWLLLRVFFESALAARGLQLDAAFAITETDEFTLDGSILF